jgi:hypothetical protein
MFLWMINLYVNPRNTITVVICLRIQRHGYGELANTLAVVALEGVVQGWDARFFAQLCKLAERYFF